MHEMLGNQYFMVRNFIAAQNEFEIASKENPTNLKIKKKLVVCLTQTGKVKKAFELFAEIAKIDLEIIFNTHPIMDDCPCPELIPIIENQQQLNHNSVDYCLTMGILWAYCDKNHSLEYFKKALQIDPTNSNISLLVFRIENYLTNQTQELSS